MNAGDKDMTDLAIQRIDGRAIAIRGNDIDTDRIIPARYLKALTFSELGSYPFYDERFDSKGEERDHPFNRTGARGAKLLFVNANFGCGSSREHAPQALKRWGIEAVIGISYGEIFAGNCEMIGVPAVRAAVEDISKLQDVSDADSAAEFCVDLERMEVRGGNLRIAIEMAENRRRALLSGHWDSTGVLVANAEQVRDVYERLPYTRGYR